MNYRLILDFGNTLRKIAVFKDFEQVEFRTCSGDVIQIIEELKSLYPKMKSAILSSVVKIDLHLMSYLKINFDFVFFDHQVSVPINNCYLTPETLGRDRLAAAVGALMKYPQQNILVIDAGSSITYELVTKEGDYLGGAISIGIQMRAKALHQFTDQLPLVQVPFETSILGNNTELCLKSGILNGAIAEMNGMIQSFSQSYQPLHIILTGGDAYYFEKRLNYNIFASENLVLTGLNYILNYNGL